MIDFRRYQVVTFDCYGTLIDWESGILDALRPLLLRHSQKLSDEAVLRLFAELESAAEAGPYQSYRDVLRQVVAGMSKRLGFAASPGEEDSLPNSLRFWKPFPDTVPALRSLKARYRLAVISNVDDDLFAMTANHLLPFDLVVTAQQCGSYKPSRNNFQRALQLLEVRPEHVLHVAQSLFHDVVPAKELGMDTVWVNRRHGRSGAGATPQVRMPVKPDLEIEDLTSLVYASNREP